MSLKLVVIDYGIGNVRSIANAFERVGVSILLTRDENAILNADGLVLPGVGAFAHGMNNLNKYSLVEVIRDFANSGKPVLGICLGMQMLMDESDEFGATEGLGIVGGRVIKLPLRNPGCEKLPHVSWNEVHTTQDTWENSILENIENGSDMYFVHSYVAEPIDKKQILSVTNYSDYEFCSSLKKGNIYGCQFHPEKSGKDGLVVIESFVNLCREK